MAFARIISGGPDGRYTIELDYGESLRTAALAATTSRLSQLDTQIAQVQVKLAEAEAAENRLRAIIAQYANDIIAAASQPKPGGTGINSLPIVTLQRSLGGLLAANQPIRDQLAALKFERANWRRKAAQWNTLPTTVQRQAWCVDYTIDIQALAYAATCDIPGDPNLVLIAPGGRAWQSSDGEFRARELLSPAQAYFNAAIFPGWQKFKPTYRWGTVTAVNYDTNRASVSLFDQRSSAQRLSVNQASTLSNVVVSYMDCDAAVFEIGDRVVVEFQGQNWANPRVIGFVDNPKPCIDWPDVVITAELENRNISAASTRQWVYFIHTAYRCGANTGVATIRALRTADVFGKWGNASFAETSTSPGSFSINLTRPADVALGNFSAQVRNASDPGASPTGDLYACTGSSPGVAVDAVTSSTPANVLVRSASYPFSTISYETWDVSQLAPTCLMIDSGSALAYDNMLLDVLNPTVTPVFSTIYDGPAVDYFGSPIISVTYTNGSLSVTRNYRVKSSSGATVTFEAIPLSP